VIRGRIVQGTAWILTILLPLNGTVLAEAESVPVERITWQRTPIELALMVGEEQRVDFPGPVKVGVPAALQAVLRVQSVAGTVYLLAHQPFEPTRVMVRTIDGGAIYLQATFSEGGHRPTPLVRERV